MNPTVALYAKPPIPGQTKSRLAEDIGTTQAASFAEALLVDNLAILAATPDVERELWIPPDANPDDFTLKIPDSITIKTQSGDDLGARMANTISTNLDAGAPACIILGSDCVTHSAKQLRQVARLLQRNEFVVQPATDGGFVLIGAAICCRFALENRRWGGSHVMTDLRRALAKRDLAELPITHDVDVIADLPHAQQWTFANRPNGAVAAWFKRQ